MFAASPPPVVQPAPVRYGFAGADLGMDFGVWRASSPAALTTPCQEEGQAQICVMGSPDLGGGYKARDLTFTFLDGRLAAIEFKTSIDGFDDATAALKKRFGEPSSISRNTTKSVDGMALPHVTMIWRNGRSTIRLDDPTPSSMSVSVRLSLDALAGRLPASRT